MPSIKVTEKQAKVLKALEENSYADRCLILMYTDLRARTINYILLSLLRRGLISKITREGSVYYQKTGMEYVLPEDFSDKEKILRFLRDSRGTTRNQISVNLGFNWKKTVRVLSILEKEGLVKKIDYNKTIIYVHA